MLQISDNSMRVLADDAFARRLAALISSKAPADDPLPANVVLILARHMIKVARSYGLKTERDISTFGLDMLTISPEFHKQPRIHAILTDDTKAPGERMRRLLSDASAQDWNDAEKMTSRAAYWASVLQSGGIGNGPNPQNP
jgi:hypothetical protein